MIRIMITLTEQERTILERLAEHNLRGTKEQVRFMLREKLRESGELPTDTEPRSAERGPQLAGGVQA